MKGVGHLKGLADVRTALSTRSRNTSRHKGTPFLEIMALGMEKLRLEGQLEWVAKRQGRSLARIEEVRQLLDTRIRGVQEEDTSCAPAASQTGMKRKAGEGSWRTMTVSY